MAISGSEESTHSVQEGSKRVVARRRGSGSCGVKRRCSSNSRWLVDYRCKQADLSANSLLRLQTLVEGSSPQEKGINLESLQLDSAHDDTFEDSVCSDDSPSATLSPPNTPPPPTSRSNSNTSLCSCDSLAGDSEHSINLEKVFEQQHEQQKKVQEALCCISVTLSEEKIKFSLRNPEVLKAVRRALAQQEEEQSTTSEQSSSQQPIQPPKLKREIKCVIPHDRFQLPQMQVIRPSEPRTSTSSHATSTVTSTAHGVARLHCIDEANEEASEFCGELSVAGTLMSTPSMASSCESFAMDSFDDDTSSKGWTEEEKQQTSSEIELQSLLTEVDGHQSTDGDIFFAAVFATEGPKDEPQPTLQVQAQEQADEEEEEEDVDTDSDALIGSLTHDSAVRYSLAESTLAGSAVGLFAADVRDDEINEDFPTAAELGYGESTTEVDYEAQSEYEESVTEFDDTEHAFDAFEDSQTEVSVSESQVVYESETDRAYDSEVALDGEDFQTSALTLGASCSSEEEYEEDMEEFQDDDEEEARKSEIRDEEDEVDEESLYQVPESDAESEREEAEQSETDGEESFMTNGTEDSSQHNAMSYGLSVYLSTHSRKAITSGGVLNKKSTGDLDSHSGTSITASLTTGSMFHSMNSSNQSSVLTSSTNRTGVSNMHDSRVSHSTNTSGSSALSTRSHLTTRTVRSAPDMMLKRQDSIGSTRSMKSELDESGHSRSSIRLEDISNATSRASSAPNEASHRSRQQRRYSNMLSGDSCATDASGSCFFHNSESEADDSTVGSAVDHRRRRRAPRRHASDLGALDKSFLSRGSRSSRGSRRGSITLNSAIIPRSNTPQGTSSLLRKLSSGESGSSRASVKGDSGPRLPPRNLSRGTADTSSTERSARRLPKRSQSMKVGASSGSNSTDRGRNNKPKPLHRVKSRESFMGGSRIKKWDSSTANRSGHGLSLLERHLNKGGQKAKRERTQRRASMSSRTHNSVMDMSLPSLAKALAS